MILLYQANSKGYKKNPPAQTSGLAENTPSSLHALKRHAKRSTIQVRIYTRGIRPCDLGLVPRVRLRAIQRSGVVYLVDNRAGNINLSDEAIIRFVGLCAVDAIVVCDIRG